MEDSGQVSKYHTKVRPQLPEGNFTPEEGFELGHIHGRAEHDIYEQSLLGTHQALFDLYARLLLVAKERGTWNLDYDHWIDFCKRGKELDNSDKASRWVGFIQGMLVANHIVNLEDTIDLSRKVYPDVYSLRPPSTLEKDSKDE